MVLVFHLLELVVIVNDYHLAVFVDILDENR